MPEHLCHILYNIWLFCFTSYFHTEDLCSNYQWFKAKIKHKNCCDVSIILVSASSYSVAVNIQQIKVYSWHYFQCGIKKNQIYALWVTEFQVQNTKAVEAKTIFRLYTKHGHIINLRSLESGIEFIGPISCPGEPQLQPSQLTWHSSLCPPWMRPQRLQLLLRGLHLQLWAMMKSSLLHLCLLGLQFLSVGEKKGLYKAIVELFNTLCVVFQYSMLAYLIFARISKGRSSIGVNTLKWIWAVVWGNGKTANLKNPDDSASAKHFGCI